MKLGFVGTGALSSAIITGLKSLPGETTPVVISPRNEEIAAGLASRYKDVRIAADNQGVLDDCDTVILGVRPQIARDVLKELRFRPDHHVVSLIATISRDVIADLVAPARQVTRAMPMLMIARLQGATLVCPPDPDIAAFFDRLGKAIEVEDPKEFDVLSVITATYASYFRLLHAIHGWAQQQGADSGRARDYVTSLYKALANAPDTAPDADFLQMAHEYATRGGINEQVMRELTERKTFDALAESLDHVYQRVRGS